LASRRNKKALNTARSLALAGRVAEAEQHLAQLADSGDLPAAASLIQLMAFRENWQGVSVYGLPLLGSPESLYSHNAYSEAVQLVALSAVRGGVVDNEHIATLAAKEERPQIRTQLERAVLLVSDPVENARVFLWEPPENRSGYDAALDRLRKTESVLFDDPAALTDRLIGNALAFNCCSVAMELAAGELSELAFENAIYLAKCLSRNQEFDRAWGVIAPRIPGWWPVDDAQVAPVALICDPDLARFMTPERRKAVLSTPRGPEA
jgi:hypothetical protein